MDDIQNATVKALVMPLVTAWLRHAVAGWGMWLLHAGLLDKNQESQFEGGLMVLAMLAWTTWDKYGRALVTAQLAKLRGHVKAIPMATVGAPSAGTNAAIAAAKVAAGALVLLLLAPFAHAATKPAASPVVARASVPVPPAKPAQISQTQAKSNPLMVLQTFTVTDLQAALADAQAQTPPDQAAVNCYSALIPLVQSGVSNPLPTGLGVFQLLQKGRDAKALLANIQSPSGPLAAINIACAPLLMDAQAVLIQLGIVGGTVAATGGLGLTLPAILPGLLPFALPF